jgi:hypothetical protein
MYETHRWVRPPSNLDTPIWRYFKRNRFEDLVESETLYFARFDQFNDAWEGVLPEGTMPLPKDGFTGFTRNPGDSMTDFEWMIHDVNLTNKLCSFANCWYMNEHESDGMWRLYGTEGIAVRSTFRRLINALIKETTHQVFAGQIQYRDFDREQPDTYGNTIAVAFSKRIQFRDEHELRALIVNVPKEWTSGSPPYEELKDVHVKGLHANVNLHSLIERVIVAPGTDEISSGSVREILDRKGISAPIENSSLDARPRLV